MAETPKRRLRDKSGSSPTLISNGVRLEGTLSGDGDVHVNGEVEANCDIDGVVTIAEAGHWTGTVRARDVIVLGLIDGDVIAANRIEIGQEARVSGTVSGSAIAVAEGAVVDGEMKTTSSKEPLTYSEKRER